jgi:hypothetical protein
MTLSIVARDGFRILTVDMLRQRTMAAGTEGDMLVRIPAHGEHRFQ